jgi:hypothetical protein
MFDTWPYLQPPARHPLPPELKARDFSRDTMNFMNFPSPLAGTVAAKPAAYATKEAARRGAAL